MHRHFDRKGKPVTFMQAAMLETPDYIRVCIDDVGEHRVSTVWLPVMHGQDKRGRPLIFETMVFDPTGKPIDQHRYATETEAKLGHVLVCSMVKEKLQ